MSAKDFAAAQKVLEEMVARVDPSAPSRDPDRPLADIADIAGELDRLVGARLHELEEKTNALESAMLELQRLNRSLDHIVRQRTRALAESESQLRRKNLELDRLNELKSQFIAIAAHELSTPMTSIVGYMDLFHERAASDLPADLSRQLESLRRNAHRMKRLIEDMLDVSRLESGAVSLRRSRTSLGEITLQAVDELRALADEKNITIAAEISDDVPAIDADADKIHQVVSNLVVNSIKFNNQGGTIRVRVDRIGSDGKQAARVRLRVWDNGRGIPFAHRRRIFEPFSDLDGAQHHTSRGPDSAGLGLHIARGIVELHGGAIEIDSEEAQYTEMTVLLPPAA